MAQTPTLALIVAAGDGSRFGGVNAKPYLPLSGISVLRRSIETFISHPRVDGVRVVIRRADHPDYRRIITGLTLFPPVIGGKTRQESVRRGLESLVRAAPARVLIHDAARPLASHALISRVLDALDGAEAAYPALPVTDTLRRGEALVERENLLAAQTPQGFHFQPIVDAHRRFMADSLTDDIALAEAAQLKVSVVPGERANIKLTTPDDLPFMQKLADSAFETRVGMGFDAHPFAAHDHSLSTQKRTIALCGVQLPFEQRLLGHSDADAGLHALVDALLGAIGAGDIGIHFPSDDPKWAGADSARFLLHAYKLLKEKGGDIVNIDITFLCERPKIATHRQQMVAQVASLLKIAPDRVNVKATTTEKMGFLGRGEGLAAQAVVAVRLPVG